MLEVLERINSKQKLIEWIKYESKNVLRGETYAKYLQLSNRCFKKTSNKLSERQSTLLSVKIALYTFTDLIAGGTNNDVSYLEGGVIVVVGAVILGGVRIAKSTNAVVNKSFDESDIAITGVPAHKVSNIIGGRIGIQRIKVTLNGKFN